MVTSSPSVAVAGEALVDIVLESGGRTRTFLGGGAYNAARTLGRLGLHPLFVGRISRDAHGTALRLGLAEADVSLNGIVLTDDPTTFARVEVDAQGVAKYRFYLAGTSSAGLEPAHVLEAVRNPPAAVYVGGFGLVVEPQATALLTLVRSCEERSLLLFDPNCRPNAAEHPSAYRARLRQMLRKADVVKASEEDLSYLQPDQPPLNFARDLLRGGPRIVLLTRGPRGVTVLSPAGEAHVDAVPTRVIDTIGAGDALGAAWLAAWAAAGRGRDELTDLTAAVSAARFAVQVAARTCTQAGAEPPHAERVGAHWRFTELTPRPAATAGI
ncbi:MAG TPA: PfkB family carbohydrate kinase [Solirubrobacteraceae bacterium]|nr:PfkB family carbohydrate kinase [Solirubrobacteraceae bacterium]